MKEAIAKHICRTKAKLRRLHFVGHCGKFPSVHFQDYVHFGDQVPDSRDLDWQCIHCFGCSGTIVTDGVEAAAAAEAASAPSSDASSEEGAVGAAGTFAPQWACSVVVV